MKRLLFLVFLCSVQVLSAGDVQAQEVVISDVSPESFLGVHSANSGEQYFVVFMDAAAQDSGNLVLKTFDRGMQARRDVGIPVAKGTQLAAYSFTGQFYVIQLVNAGNKTRSTIVVDEAGNILKRKDETDIKASALSPSSAPALYPVSMNEYLVVQTNRDGRPVLEMELKDLDANSRWQKTFESQNTSELVELKTEMDRVYLLKKEKVQSRNTYSIQSLSGMSGDVFYSTEIREGDNIAVPGFFTVQHSFLTTAGVFHKENTPGKSEGLFLAQLSPTGTPEKMHYVPWMIIKTQTKNAVVSEIENGKAGVLMQSAIPDISGGGFTLIGEVYKKVAGAEANTATFSVQDFLLFHLNKEGQVDKVSSVSKNTEELLIKGAMSAKTGEELAQWLDKNRFFSYRAILPMMEKNVIAYITNKNGKATGYFATIDSTGAVAKDNIALLPIDRDETAEKSRGRDKDMTASAAILNSTEKDLRDFATTRSAKDIVFAHEGHVLIYNYTNPDLKFWIVPVPAH